MSERTHPNSDLACDMLKVICSAGERCSCADKNYQWRDHHCDVAISHVNAIAARAPQPLGIAQWAPDRDAIARIVNPIAFTALERSYVVPAAEEFIDMKIAREKADAVLALSSTPAQPRMRADIAQMIDRGWKAGKSSNDVAEEILREFDEPAQSSWMPIETAPRDGTAILATGGGLDDSVQIVSYLEHVGAWETSEVTLDDRDDEADGYSRPTHWMPLPEGPTKNADTTQSLSSTQRDGEASS